MGSPVGLNYQSAEVIFRIYEVTNHREMLEELAEIEAGALEAFARMSEKRKESRGS